MLYDSHTHLNDDKLFPERKKYLENFADAGGKGLVNIGTDKDISLRAIEIAQQAKNLFPDLRVKAAVGYHPSEIIHKHILPHQFAEKISELKSWVENNKDDIVGIGECGVDFHYEGAAETTHDQKTFFGMQCDLAQELGLPVVIHSREGFDPTMDVLKNYKDLKIYFHCRGYGPDEIKILQENFPQLRFGFCGNTTYPKAQILRDSLLAARHGNFLFETDAPYLAPQALRGQTNEPANVRLIYEFASEFLEMPKAEVGKKVEENFQRLYGR